MKKTKGTASDDEIDYGAVADIHAGDDEVEDEVEPSKNQINEDEDNDIDDGESSSSVDEDLDEDAEEHIEDESEEDNEVYPSNNVVVDGGDEPCTFDLRNLLAFNAHAIDTAVLYAANKKLNRERATIPSQISVDESHLYRKAQAGCKQLIAALWQLPTERSDVGPMVKLPANDDSRVPRALVCTTVCLLRCSLNRFHT